MTKNSYIVEDTCTNKKWLMPTLDCVSKHTGSSPSAIIKVCKDGRLLKYRWKVTRVQNADVVKEIVDGMEGGQS